jgi:pantoate--beta-alanine ligase
MTLDAVTSVGALRDLLGGPRREGKTIGLVPTMGALHAGHAALIARARQDSDVVVVSIFVNPLQFGPKEDFERYPRNLAEDLLFCEVRGVNFVFAPSGEEIYPESLHTWIEVGPEAEMLCGELRPGHFRAVATVVLKLLGIVGPDAAYFGEKDFQQLTVIRRMVADFNVPARIVAVPTVREADGLALSSRNAGLDPEERRSAAAIYRALRVMRQRIADGDRTVSVVRKAGLKVLELEPMAEVEYLEVVDPVRMQPVRKVDGPVRVVTSVRIGRTRLIDNVPCEPGRRPRRRRAHEAAD